jgi:penicillin amidase
MIFSLVPIINTASPARVAAQDDATLAIPGLQNEVTVIYDNMGIPHIYADNTNDLFMAQGYVEASHRWWQMEWWRHQSAGRLSEIAGETTSGIDVFLRTLNFQRAAEKDLEVISDEALTILDAYTAGVNAYLDGKEPAEAAVEYQFLAQAGITLDLKPWNVTDTLRWFKVMSFDLSGNFQAEIERALIAEDAGAIAQFAVPFFFPEFDFENYPVIVQPGGVEYDSSPVAYQVPETDFSNVSLNLAGGLALDEIPTVFGRGIGIGSNSWVIGPEMTDSGLPYLANDPHLGIQMPSIWYEVGLHCTTVSDECPFDVVGVSFAGAPGIIIGHNHRIAWGFTNVGTDVQDLYTLEINPDNPNQYMLDGEWTDFEVVTETIRVNGGEDIELDILYSVWGPVISEVAGIEDMVLAMRWTAFDANTTLDALLTLNTATDWDSFRDALRFFDVPAQNIIYADVDGNIGYQMPGKTPIRAEGHDPRFPVDGSNSDNAWQGFVDFEELPSLFNPEEGYIVTANNSVVGPDYPHYITADWAYGYRAKRIEQMIQNDADGVFTVEEIQAMQGDNYNLKADYLIPALQNITFEDETLSDAVTWLAEWDRQNDMDSGQAALFEAYWVELLTDVFEDDLGVVPGGSARWWGIMGRMLSGEANTLVADQVWGGEPAEIMAGAFAEAYTRMVALQGEDPMAWRWGDLHTASFRAAPLGQGVDPQFDLVLDATFNVHVEAGGGTAIVNATGWDASDGDFAVEAVPSMRQILIPGDWDSSLRINTVGQSGNPQSRHYKNQVEMWRDIEYHPDWFSREAVEADASATWTLTPAE